MIDCRKQGKLRFISSAPGLRFRVGVGADQVPPQFFSGVVVTSAASPHRLVD
jgi:hypothetical protein